MAAAAANNYKAIWPRQYLVLVLGIDDVKLGEVVKVGAVADLDETSHLYQINALAGTRRADPLRACTGQKGP